MAAVCGGLWMTGYWIHRKCSDFYGPLMVIFWFLCGSYGYYSNSESQRRDLGTSLGLFRGYILDNPKEKAKTWSCRVRLESITDSLHQIRCKEDILLYVQKDSLSAGLRKGEGVCWIGHLQSLCPSLNLSGFDYSDYLRAKGIHATAYLPSDSWEADAQSNHVESRLEQLHTLLQHQFYTYFPEKGIRAVLSALTLGDKDELDTEQKVLFAHVGASHLLALSGLHLGFICAFLEFILSFLWSFRARQVKCVIIMAFLWLFTWFVGAPNSLIRASVMFTMMYVSRCASRSYFSLNALLWAAFLMLLWNPSCLFDLGTQLSFTAVFGIVLLVPWAQSVYQPKNRCVRYIWNVMMVSVAAQIGVLPVTLYHFGTQPVYFMLTNLFSIPLIAVILLFAVLFLSLSWFHPCATGIASILKSLWTILEEFLGFVQNLPHSVLYCRLDLFESVLLGLALFCLLYAIRGRNYRVGIVGISFCFIGSGYHLYADSPHMRRSVLTLGLHDGEDTYIRWSCSRKQFYQWKVGEEPPSGSPFAFGGGIISFPGLNMCVLSSDDWTACISHSEPYPIDYLYVTKSYKGSLSDLRHLFQVRNVVLDASVGIYRTQKWKEECSRAEVPVLLLSEKGFLQIKL